MEFLKKEPALTGALCSALGAVLALFIHNPALVAALVGVAATFMGVRGVVTPVATAAVKITDAATQAATDAVRDVDATAAGAVGQVTDAAQTIVENTVGRVVAGILGR